jgi:U5 small nuclear ribonucleoprotein component
MYDLMAFPPRVRNVAIVGHLHHGKSSIMDMLINETHEKNMNIDLQERYTDTHPLERARGVSIKSMPMTLVMQDTKDVSYLLNVIDTPGNVFDYRTNCRLFSMGNNFGRISCAEI